MSKRSISLTLSAFLRSRAIEFSMMKSEMMLVVYSTAFPAAFEMLVRCSLRPSVMICIFSG